MEAGVPAVAARQAPGSPRLDLASEKCSYLEELSCKENSLKDNRFCFNQNQDTV